MLPCALPKGLRNRRAPCSGHTANVRRAGSWRSGRSGGAGGTAAELAEPQVRRAVLRGQPEVQAPWWHARNPVSPPASRGDVPVCRVNPTILGTPAALGLCRREVLANNTHSPRRCRTTLGPHPGAGREAGPSPCILGVVVSLALQPRLAGLQDYNSQDA